MLARPLLQSLLSNGFAARTSSLLAAFLFLSVVARRRRTSRCSKPSTQAHNKTAWRRNGGGQRLRATIVGRNNGHCLVCSDRFYGGRYCQVNCTGRKAPGVLRH